MPPEKHLEHADAVAAAVVRVAGAQARRRSLEARGRWLARLFVFGGGLLLTAYGTYEMYQVVSVSRTTVLQWVLVALFTVNFSWIAVAFTSALLGFLAAPALPRRAPGRCRQACQSAPRSSCRSITSRLTRTFAALEAIYESVEATGLGAAFRLFHPLRHDRSRCLDRGGARLPGPARAPRPRRAILLPPPREELSPQGRQHRGFRVTLGRALRAHAGPRRRQPDDRRMHRAARRRHGGRSRCRHHPVAAADHQPQHLLRPPPAIRRARLRAR